MAYSISDHFDGTHFFNPEPTIRSTSGKRTSTLSFILRRLRRDPADWSKWPDHIENVPYPAPGGEVAAGSAAVTFIGHSCFLIRLPGLTVLTDPVFSERCSPVSFAGPKRVRAPGLALAALPKVDLVLLSHNHYDHMDVASLRKLRRRFPGMRIVTTLGNAAFLARKGLAGAVELDWWQSHGLGETRITATPARHFAARTLWDRNETLWAGFVLEHRDLRIYFAGDSGYTNSSAKSGSGSGRRLFRCCRSALMSRAGSWSGAYESGRCGAGVFGSGRRPGHRHAFWHVSADRRGDRPAGDRSGAGKSGGRSRRGCLYHVGLRRDAAF